FSSLTPGALERNAPGELQDSWAEAQAGDLSERARRPDFAGAAFRVEGGASRIDGAARTRVEIRSQRIIDATHRERRMVEHVVSFGTKSESHMLRDRDVLLQCHVPVIRSGPSEDDIASKPGHVRRGNYANRRQGEGILVEVLQRAMHLVLWRVDIVRYQHVRVIAAARQIRRSTTTYVD